MSKYEWERGTITLPSNQWAAVRKGLLSKWNAKQDEIFADAKRAYAAVKAAAKGKRGKGRQTAMTDALNRHCGGRKTEGVYWGFDGVDYERHDALSRLVFKRDGWNAPVALQTPKRKDLDTKPVSKDADICCGEASVHFRNKGRTVTWDVPENNRACESAREHWFAGALFAALNKVTWTRGSGGTIVGNDEYNRDCDYDGGGGNYTVATYSKAQQEADRKVRASYRSTGYFGRSYGRYGF